MPRSAEAIVKPQMLIWARESSSYAMDQAARKLDVPLSRLAQWEQGRLRPTITQLRSMAALYKRPLAAFYLPEVPPPARRIHDFRRVAQADRTEISAVLAIEIRKARNRRSIALELREQMGEATVRLGSHARVGQDPDKLAEWIRMHLGISIKDQMGWHDRGKALREWKRAVERAGVLVFETASNPGIPLVEMRGFSIAEEQLPVIVLNGGDAQNGKIFTLLHEFAHLVLGGEGICDLEPKSVATSTDVEVFCNRVAGAVLVPGDSLVSEALVQQNRGVAEWSDSDVAELADRYSVSQEVVVRRLLLLDFTSGDFYYKKRKEYQQAEAERRQMDREAKRGRSGGPPPAQMAVRDNGVAYTRLVIEAYYGDKIDLSDLSEYLGIRVKHLRKIEDVVSRSGWPPQ